MPRFASFVIVACLASAAGSQVPQQGASAPPQPQPAERKICRTVVASDPGAKPYELCMTKVEWAAKEAADAKNPNRKVCRYSAAPGSRFKSYKVCMTAAEWENQRQLERQAIERIQSGTCVVGAGC